MSESYGSPGPSSSVGPELHVEQIPSRAYPDLRSLAADSELVIQGEALPSAAETASRSGLTFTITNVRVARTFKGGVATETVSVWQDGDASMIGPGILQAGRVYVLFLERRATFLDKPVQNGFNVVGVAQGIYHQASTDQWISDNNETGSPLPSKLATIDIVRACEDVSAASTTEPVRTASGG